MVHVVRTLGDLLNLPRGVDISVHHNTGWLAHVYLEDVEGNMKLYLATDQYCNPEYWASGKPYNKV